MNNSEEKKRIQIDDKYSEAWSELGSPIWKPFLKYLIAVIQYLVDNFFLIKNTYNALQYEDDSGEFNHAKSIAAGIVGLHIISSFFISVIDSFNKDAISGRRGKHLNAQHKWFMFFRVLAHLTLTMKLFRYTTAYLENRRKNAELEKLRMRRSPISAKEIQFVLDEKKNQLVESHYDLIESFLKTIPSAFLQVFFMFQLHPDARLRLYSTTDQDRFATVFFTIITASISSVNYQFDYMAYKKILHFKHCFLSGFAYKINLEIPGDISFVNCLVVQIATIGMRMCFYSIILFWNPKQFIITIILLLIVNWFLTIKWSRTSWRFRPVLENPLYGTPWFCFDMIDLWINLFVPGVHYPKPLDHFLNFYTATFIGVFVFRGFDFLSPTHSGNIPQFLPTKTEVVNNSLDSNSFGFYDRFDQNFKINSTTIRTTQSKHEEETIFFIGTIVKYLLLVHEYLTFNQISYAGFFYSVVKFMNVINLACLIDTLVMNFLKLYDLDFPIQIANEFMVTIIQSLNRPLLPEVDGLLIQSRKAEVFLTFSMLSNSRFFSYMGFSDKSKNWKAYHPEKIDEIISSIINEKKKSKSGCFKNVYNILLKVSPVLYPARFRVAKIKWNNVSTEKSAILDSIKDLRLVEQLTKFVDLIYENANDDKKLLLAVYCSNYNEIQRHLTSLRIQKTFKFLEIPIEKQSVSEKSRSQRVKHNYEMGYWQRFLREIKGEVQSVFS